MEIIVKILLCPYFIFFSGFQTWLSHAFILPYRTSNTASDDVTN